MTKKTNKLDINIQSNKLVRKTIVSNNLLKEKLFL